MSKFCWNDKDVSIIDHCERCKKKTGITTMSVFNTQIICLDCQEEEQRHPNYEKAREAEAEAVRRGDYNFPGIGWKR